MNFKVVSIDPNRLLMTVLVMNDKGTSIARSKIVSSRQQYLNRR